MEEPAADKIRSGGCVGVCNATNSPPPAIRLSLDWNCRSAALLLMGLMSQTRLRCCCVTAHAFRL